MLTMEKATRQPHFCLKWKVNLDFKNALPDVYYAMYTYMFCKTQNFTKHIVTTTVKNLMLCFFL